jgi:pimeloyl-ACP methyl ester carboxylesterase
MLLTVHGAKAYCNTGGAAFDPARPTVVFIHGAMNDHTVWSEQSRHFASRGYSVLAIDLPGHGHSSGPACTSVEAMADWLLAVLDAAGVQHAVLVGHSMGSLVALHVAGTAPKRVSHLVLIGTAFPMRVAEALLETAREDEPRAIGMVAKWSHTPGHAALPQLRELMVRLSQDNPAHLLYTDLAACQRYDGGAAAAQTLRCPALFIFGAGDVMTPPSAARPLIDAIVHAHTLTLEGGHALMAEQPGPINHALAGFIGNR